MKKTFAAIIISALLFINEPSNLSKLPIAKAKEDQDLPLRSLQKPPRNSTEKYHEGEVIVKYKKETTREFQSFAKQSLPEDQKVEAIDEKKKEILSSLKKSSDIDDLQITDHVNDLGISLITSEKESTKNLVEKLEKSNVIEYVEPNYTKTPSYAPNDTYFSSQWAHYRSDDHDVDTTNAWDNESSSATNTIVAVIDSGVDYNFPDLSGNMWNGSMSCKSDAGTTITCPYHGWDYDDNDNNPDDTANTIEDFQWHGTHVASIIGATTNNASGIAGMSRYNHIKIMALRFNLDIFSEIKAINFAKNNGAKVINASFAGEGYSQGEKDAIDTFPGIVISAAGNGGNDNIGDNNDTSHLYPCNYSSSNIICAGSTSNTDTISSFSNYGESVDIAAPGESILGVEQNTYWYGSGTSFSSPLVAGATALLYAHNTSASITTIRNTLLKSSDHITTLTGKISCGRRLNVDVSLKNLKNSIIPTESCATPVYRFWSDQNQGHFYTTNEDEKNSVINNYDDRVWRYEGIAFYASNNDGIPIYRFWSDQNQHHFYTASSEERDQVINNYDDFVWRYEGIAFYAF